LKRQEEKREGVEMKHVKSSLKGGEKREGERVDLDVDLDIVLDPLQLLVRWTSHVSHMDQGGELKIDAETLEGV
jgi:hypothetical protein